MLTASNLDQACGVAHGFFTRHGGVSTGRFASLNCGFGSGDAPARVAENRARAVARLGPPGAVLVTARQAHTARAVPVAAPWPLDRAPEADGLATDRPGVVLGILTADCAPVLFADPEGGVVGAAHAGWKGALGGVLEATVAAMQALGAAPDRIRAAVGPCIRQPSYEVGPEFRDRFVAVGPGSRVWFTAAERPDHWLFDLAGYVADRLEGCGLARIETVNADTCADEARFFSYRRGCRRGEPEYGRLLSAVTLAPG